MPAVRPGFLITAAVLFVTAKGAWGQDVSDLPPDVQRQLAELWQPWKFTAEADASAGYDDNIYLSTTDPIGGGFVRGGLDARLMRLPTPTDPFSGFAFVTGDSTHFFSGSRAVDPLTGAVNRRPDEEEWDSGLEVHWQPLPALEFSAEADGYYQDQVFDLSATTAAHTIAEMRDLTALGFLRARWHFWRGFWLEGEVQQQHDHFTEFSGENFDQRGGAGRLGWSRAGRAEVSFTYAERRRDYFEQTQYTAVGRALAAPLSFIQREGNLRGEIDWSLGGDWSAATTLGYLANRDNGPGYFSFDEKSAHEELAWERGAWRIALDGKAARYVFTVQQVGFGTAPTPRLVENYDDSLRVERKLAAHWKVFAEEHWERNRSNDGTSLYPSSYRTNTTLAGAAYTY